MSKTASLPTRVTPSQPATRNPVYRFRSRRLAESFRTHAVKPMWLMLGDHDGEHGTYLVVYPVDCERLAHAGYEYA